MSVQFNEFNYKKSGGGEKLTGTAKFLMKISGGLIKGQKQANAVTLIITVVFFALSIYFFLS
jgi:hypothetical protein